MLGIYDIEDLDIGDKSDGKERAEYKHGYTAPVLRIRWISLLANSPSSAQMYLGSSLTASPSPSSSPLPTAAARFASDANSIIPTKTLTAAQPSTPSSTTTDSSS